MSGFGTRSIAVLIAIGLLAPALAAAQVEVTACGQIVTDGYLTADLDCSGFLDPVTIPEWIPDYNPPTIMTALVVARRGRLDLRGHTLTANDRGIYCLGSCRIIGGGGTVANAQVHGIDSDLGQHVRVEGVTVVNSVQTGIWSNYRLTVTDSTIRDNPGRGIFVGRALKLVRTTITNNGEVGISASAGVVLTDTNVDDNCTILGTACVSRCADLLTPRKPRVKRSICGTSRSGKGPCAMWPVCADDFL